jgi:uncharacterized protein (DUF169 family)
MDMLLKNKFLANWDKFVPTADLPFAFYYTNESKSLLAASAPSTRRCLLCDLAKVRSGQSVCFDIDSVGCPGGRRYLGFSQEVMPNFEYFLSTGIPGSLEGERYKKSPDLVKEAMAHAPRFKAPGRFVVFKRWDMLEEFDNPEVVIFYAAPDVLSGLFTLANFDEAEPNAVYTPFAAGCGTIVQYPLMENAAPRPRCVLGMFDVSSRPCVPAGILSFAVPFRKFISMVDHMEESFLITHSWELVRKRIEKLTPREK